jgi:hypothetical protein
MMLSICCSFVTCQAVLVAGALIAKQQFLHHVIVYSMHMQQFVKGDER